MSEHSEQSPSHASLSSDQPRAQTNEDADRKASSLEEVEPGEAPKVALSASPQEEAAAGARSEQPLPLLNLKVSNLNSGSEPTAKVDNSQSGIEQLEADDTDRPPTSHTPVLLKKSVGSYSELRLGFANDLGLPPGTPSKLSQAFGRQKAHTVDAINIPELTALTMKGPNHPFPTLDDLMLNVKPKLWRNVPVPVIEAIEKIIKCLDQFKVETFENYNETINVKRSVAIDRRVAQSTQKQIQREIVDDYLLYHEQTKDMIHQQSVICRASEQGIKDHLNANLKEYVQQRISEDQLMLKDWTKHVIADQVRVSQNQLRDWFNRQLVDMRRNFNVPGVIGDQFNSTQVGPDKQTRTAPFADHKEFVQKIYQDILNFKQEVSDVTEIVGQQQKKFKMIETDLSKKVSELDHDKAEKKAKLAFEGKLIEIKEQQRIDRNDYNQKLANFKVDVSEMTFERETLDYFKKQIYPNWGKLFAKSRDHESLLDEMTMKQEELRKKVQQIESTSPFKRRFGTMVDKSNDSKASNRRSYENSRYGRQDSRMSPSDANEHDKSSSQLPRSYRTNPNRKQANSNRQNNMTQGTPKEGGDNKRDSLVSPTSSAVVKAQAEAAAAAAASALNQELKARILALEENQQDVESLTQQVEETRKQLGQVKLQLMVAIASKANSSPLRSERGRDAQGRTDTEKRDLLKKRGNVLDIKQNKNRKSQPTTHQSTVQTPSGVTTPQVDPITTLQHKDSAQATEAKQNEKALAAAAEAQKAAASAHSQERDMRHDQVTVETMLRNPPIPTETSPRPTMGHPVQRLNLQSFQNQPHTEQQQIRTSPSPTHSEHLDERLLHLEHMQYTRYLEEFNRQDVQRKMELHRAQQEERMAIQGISASQLPSVNKNFVHSYNMRVLPGQQSSVMLHSQQQMQQAIRESGAKSAQKVRVRSNLNHLVVSKVNQTTTHYGGVPLKNNQDLSINYESTLLGAQTGQNFFQRGSAEAMMTSKSLATNHHMRHKSLNLAKGGLQSIGNQDTQAHSSSLIATNENRQDLNSSKEVLNSEISRIKEFALQKHMQKNEQKLFRSQPRSQTGRGRAKAMSVLVNRGQPYQQASNSIQSAFLAVAPGRQQSNRQQNSIRHAVFNRTHNTRSERSAAQSHQILQSAHGIQNQYIVAVGSQEQASQLLAISDYNANNVNTCTTIENHQAAHETLQLCQQTSMEQQMAVQGTLEVKFESIGGSTLNNQRSLI